MQSEACAAESCTEGSRNGCDSAHDVFGKDLLEFRVPAQYTLTQGAQEGVASHDGCTRKFEATERFGLLMHTPDFKDAYKFPMFHIATPSPLVDSPELKVVVQLVGSSGASSELPVLRIPWKNSGCENPAWELSEAVGPVRKMRVAGNGGGSWYFDEMLLWKGNKEVGSVAKFAADRFLLPNEVLTKKTSQRPMQHHWVLPRQQISTSGDGFVGMDIDAVCNMGVDNVHTSITAETSSAVMHSLGQHAPGEDLLLLLLLAGTDSCCRLRCQLLPAAMLWIGM